LADREERRVVQGGFLAQRALLELVTWTIALGAPKAITAVNVAAHVLPFEHLLTN
jgi:hypothetical protein